jgi:hypothetical protein
VSIAPRTGCQKGLQAAPEVAEDHRLATRVTAHYTGRVAADESVRLGSVDRGKPFNFTVGVETGHKDGTGLPRLMRAALLEITLQNMVTGASGPSKRFRQCYTSFR